MSAYKKGDDNERCHNDQLPQDIIEASTALENLQLDTKTLNPIPSSRHVGDEINTEGANDQLPDDRIEASKTLDNLQLDIKAPNPTPPSQHAGDEISTGGAQEVTTKESSAGGQKVINKVLFGAWQVRQKKVRFEVPSTQWISVYNSRQSMKQRYHYDVSNESFEDHFNKGIANGLFISCAASRHKLWAFIMDAGTGFTDQLYKLSPLFLPKEWIVEQWAKGYAITSIAGTKHRRSLVVMSKGTQFTQQSYKVKKYFPLKWINQKWKEGLYVTSMATAGSRWAVVMSRNAGFSKQVVELDPLYPSEIIHKHMNQGYRITSAAATLDQSALILSIGSGTPNENTTQQTLCTSKFPTTQIKKKWKKKCYIACLCYGRTLF